MVDYLRDFIKVLRSSDVRISTSETIDAMHAASLIGIEYEKDNGPTGVNQLTEIPVADLILSESKELS